MAVANVTQTTAAKLLSELWASQPEYAVNNARGVSQSIWDSGETYFGPGFKLHIPIVGTIAASSYSGSVANVIANTETEITVTPTVKYAAVYLQEDVLLTTAYDTVRTYTPALAEGIYQQIDIDLLSLFASFTSTDITDAAGFTEGALQQVVSSILSAGGDKVQVGQLDGWYHPLKWKEIMAIGNIINASVRGEDNSSAKTGTIGQAYGVNFKLTKNVQTSTTLRNLVLSKKSMVLCRKNRPKVEMERSDLLTKVVASTMYGVVVLHQATGGMHRITTTT